MNTWLEATFDPQNIHVDSCGFRVASGGCGAKAPPPATRQVTVVGNGLGQFLESAVRRESLHSRICKVIPSFFLMTLVRSSGRAHSCNCVRKHTVAVRPRD